MASAKKGGNTKAKQSRVQVRDLKPRKDAKGGVSGLKISGALSQKVSPDATSLPAVQRLQVK